MTDDNSSYERGYQDGESSMSADLAFLLDEYGLHREADPHPMTTLRAVLSRLAKTERVVEAAQIWDTYEDIGHKLDPQELGDAGDAYAELREAIRNLDREDRKA